MDTVFRKKRIVGCESGDRFSIHGGVPKWLKGPDSKSGFYAECQTAETLGTMRVPAEFKLNNVACSILLFFPISTG